MKKQIKRIVHAVLSFMLVLTCSILGVSIPASAADPTLATLSTLTAGNTVNFGGYTWIVLNPGTGYLLMQSSGISRSFDQPGFQTFNPSSSENIAYYLNNDFYNSLPSAGLPLIQSHSWTTGNETNESSDSVDCKIGLISYNEYNKYKSIISSSDRFWTRTPYSGESSSVWYVNSSGSLKNDATSNNSAIVRPALYLNSDILVSGGNGGTVTSALGTPVIKVVNGVPFSVTIDNTFGTLTGTNTTYGTLTGVASGNGNVISGTLSGLSTSTLTYIPLGAGIIEVQAVSPPSTTVLNPSFY